MPYRLGADTLLNGELFTVTQLERDGSLLACSERLKNEVRFTSDTLQYLELAYASTIDSAQGGAWVPPTSPLQETRVLQGFTLRLRDR
jgi:hypothetical protein